MNIKQLFTKYYKRITTESLLKSLVFGLIVGFALSFVLALVCWFFKLTYLIPLLSFVGATAMATFLMYRCVYKPTAKTVASRIDELGLEERVLTMTELENDTSYIAEMQRKDTLSALSTVNEKLIKIIVSVQALIILAIAFLVGSSMTTVSALAYAGIIKSGKEVVKEITEKDPAYYHITYKGKGDNVLIVGDEKQIVQEGKSADEIIAMISWDYAFVEWQYSVKGNPFGESFVEGPYRHDLSVLRDVTVTAIVEELEFDLPEDDQEGGGGMSMGQGQPNGQPQEGNNQNGQGQPNSRSPQNGNAPMQYQPTNQVYNGETYFGNVFEDSFKDAMEELGQATDIPQDLIDAIEDYYKTIEEKPVEEEN